MVVENLMLEPDLVSRFAVCCTADLTLEAINRFCREVQQKEREEGTAPIFTIIHALDAHYTGPTKELRGDSPLQTPFLGADAARVKQLLQQIRDTTESPLKTNWFLLLDDKSDETSTAVIVNSEDSVRTVRVAYPVASRYLMAASVAHPSLDEMIEIANETNNGILDD